MPYADTDFFIVLAKKDDHLKKSAENLLSRHRNNLETSSITITESLLVAEKKDIDPDALIGSIFQLSKVEGITLEEAMTASHLVKEKFLNAFDAMHAVLARNKEIISSDEKYEKSGFKTIKIESDNK